MVPMNQSEKPAGNPPPAPPAVLRWVRDGWLIIGLVLLLVVILDALLKALLPEPWAQATVAPGVTAPDRRQADALADAEWADAYFAELKAARHTRWQPWTYWRRESFSGNLIHIDQDGIRRSWQPPRPRFRIWMLGGSTVWGTGARDEYTLPSALARELHRLGLPAQVINLGESGYVSGQDQVRLLRRLEQHPPPDAVVFYGGANDVFAALQAGHAGLSQNEHHRVSDFRVTDGLDNWLAAAPAALEGVMRAQALLAGASGRASQPTEALASDVAVTFARRMDAAAAVLRDLAVPHRVFWQPTVFSRARPQGDEPRIVGASLSAHQQLQLASDEQFRKHLAGRAGFHDLTNVLDAQAVPYYLDFCHLSEAGNQVVAAHIASVMAGVLSQRADASESSD